MFEEYIKLKEREVLSLLVKKSYKKILFILEEVFYKVKDDDLSIFHNFFQWILITDPKLFEGSFYNQYLKTISLVIPSDQVFRMETYLINQICTHPDEKVGTSFFGKLFYTDLLFEGRIYITEFRIFVIGTKRKNPEIIKQRTHKAFKRAQAIRGPRGGLLSLFTGFIMARAIESATARHHRKQEEKIHRKKSEVRELVNFGFQFPILEAKTYLEVDKIRFDSVFIHAGEEYKISISIAPILYRGETRDQYFERLEDLYADYLKSLEML